MLSFFLTVLESAADRRLFASIYEQHHSKMERIAINMLKNQGDAEDAVQNAFMQVIRNFEKINQIPSEELPFWIISIVKNECYMILRKQKRVVLVDDLSLFAESAADVPDYAALVDLFSNLPDTYRQVLEMKVLLGYTDKEISARLGITETAVSTRASRGRQLLRDILDKEGFQL